MSRFWIPVSEQEPPKGDGSHVGPKMLSATVGATGELYGHRLVFALTSLASAKWSDGSNFYRDFPGTHWAHIPDLDDEMKERANG